MCNNRFGSDHEMESEITHNERLEFLGDAVVEFVTSIHLFHLFPDLEEGGLATYRAAIVQNQHLAVLAKVFVQLVCVIETNLILFFTPLDIKFRSIHVICTWK